MTLLLTDRFKEDFRRLPKAIQRRTEKALRLLAENLRHPSLRAKKWKA
jgi:mRNA-degrading endonuclease RelE of RelBE toxin-antitoxin system